MEPLSDCSGRIRHVVFHCKENLVARAAKPVYELLKALDPDIQITLLCNSDAACDGMTGRLKAWGFSDRANIRLLRLDGPLTVWSRDRYIACRRAGGGARKDSRTSEAAASPITWLIPQVQEQVDEPGRLHDREIPAALQRMLGGFEIQEIPLTLEGGNVVSSPTHIFIGANVVSENAHRLPSSELDAELERLFARPVVLVHDGDGRTPQTHVDLYLTPIDDRRVLLGSPALAAEVLKDADEKSRQEIDLRLFEQADRTPERAALFERIAEHLRGQGREVLRIPYLDSTGGTYVVSYNNVLMDHRDGRKIVYLPAYQAPAMDAAARRVYESLGFEVWPIDVSPISHLSGMVRCIANVVERE